jgi:hypothetical protein
MKNLNKKKFGLLFAIMALTACNKELNVYPTTSEVDGHVIVDKGSALTVLNGVYYRFANASADANNVPTIKWQYVNEVFPSVLSGTLVNPATNWSPAAFTSSTNGADALWIYGYDLVNAANGFLKNIAPVPSISDATKKEMIAEAKFLRAFANSELLLYYGQFYDVTSKYGIIIRDEFVNSGNINLSRSTVGDCYTAILNDLDAAIPDLPSLNTNIYYANASAAKLLKARVLINRGAAGDYDQIINITTDIINSKLFALESNTKDIFQTKGFNSKEVIMGVQPYPTQNYKYNNNQYYFQYQGTLSLESLLSGDPRNQWIYKAAKHGSKIQDQLTKYYSGDPVKIAQTSLSEYCYAFRLTEAYLLKAEALAANNGDLQLAKTLVADSVMSHNGIAGSSSIYQAVKKASTPLALRVLIVKEEMKNFISENGTDWFALRRLPLDTIKVIQSQIQVKDRLILPIPRAEITNNGKMIQNPSY